MRALLLVTMLISACGKDHSSDPTGPPHAPSTAVTAEPLAVDHATLLEPENVIAKRVVDQDAFAAAIKGVTAAVIAYDAKHPNALPTELDAVVVMRPSGTRLWLVCATGDLPIPELESAVAAMPKVAVSEGNVAVITTLARAKAATRAPYLPASWKAAAGNNGSDVDSIIDAVWPR